MHLDEKLFYDTHMHTLFSGDSEANPVEIAQKANDMADQIRDALRKAGYTMPVESATNQVFAIMPDCVLNELSKNFLFAEWERVDNNHRMVRFCTSWSTQQNAVDLLCKAITA